MYTVSKMHAIFVIHCSINMKPLNNTQPTTNQLATTLQSINQPQFFVWCEGGPKNTFVLSPHIYRLVPACECYSLAIC